MSRFGLFVTVGAVAFAAAIAAAVPVARAAAPTYYFRLRDVKAGPEIDATLKAYAGEALKAELASRPEWASDLGVQASSTDALVAELKRRNLRGFDVNVRFDGFKKELKEPKPGERSKRLELEVKLSVFGTTIPEEKLAFSGDGEAGLEAPVPSEARADAQTNTLAKDAIKDAVKQAVDQAVMKLSIGQSEPANQSKHRKKKKP
jgi:hypothetical protein